MKDEIIIGFDYGSKKIGVAVGNMFTKITTPLFNLNQMKHKDLFEQIDKIVEEWLLTNGLALNFCLSA